MANQMINPIKFLSTTKLKVSVLTLLLSPVEIAVRCMEDDCTFNAGRGSVLNAEGKVEMDAIVMEGSSLKFGAVAGVRNISNPVSLARMVMERTEHVMLVGEGANRFAREMGVEEVDPSELVSKNQRKIWEEFNKYGSVVSTQMNRVAPKERAGPEKDNAGVVDIPAEHRGHDTVGAVALDLNGDLAAATSTGGITLKRPGRVGDSPLVGSGAYCDNSLGGVSCTGHGESIARVLLAQRALSLVETCGAEDPLQAVGRALEYMLTRTGGRGGLIMIDGKGRLIKGFSTVRMAWASVDQTGRVQAGIDEPQHHC